MDEAAVMTFCEALPELRRTARADPDEAAEVEAVAEAVREGRGDLIVVGDLATRLGVRLDGRRGDGGTYVTVPGLAGGGGGILRYRCPRGMCARSEDPTASVSAPRCAVWGAELRRVRY
ncbi:hypothetical protein ACFYXS_11255 [Streptomyces sp. NPDC002574]|uniref:hypothetical protein n=1 Tax=Streptomyces sp. NPDC002574 TaxID=3364652 RepID=UPI0036AFF14F